MSNLPDDLVGPRLVCPVEANEQLELVHDEIRHFPRNIACRSCSVALKV